ncbi:hypothetical protein [Amycolatopsis sp. NPDC004169]|uniref:hypothetical protein n=1 Tax=Amycolatopsis sp. NPDC004169 TaxID=3154453 RepID=UPI0033A3687E
MSVEIELVDGPAGQRRIVIDSDPFNPRETVEMQQEPSARALDPATPLPPGRRLLYRRAEPSPDDHGPLWRYRFERELPL